MWGRPEPAPPPEAQGRRRIDGLLAASGRTVQNRNDLQLDRGLAASICEGRLRAVIQMATGGGKAVTAITAGYRLITQGVALLVLFLLDRSNLGRQSLNEFQASSIPDRPGEQGADHQDPAAAFDPQERAGVRCGFGGGIGLRWPWRRLDARPTAGGVRPAAPAQDCRSECGG